MNEKINTDEEVQRRDNSETAEAEANEDLTEPNSDNESIDETETHEPEPEQALEFLMGGERYTQD